MMNHLIKFDLKSTREAPRLEYDVERLAPRISCIFYEASQVVASVLAVKPRDNRSSYDADTIFQTAEEKSYFLYYANGVSIVTDEVKRSIDYFAGRQRGGFLDLLGGTITDLYSLDDLGWYFKAVAAEVRKNILHHDVVPIDSILLLSKAIGANPFCPPQSQAFLNKLEVNLQDEAYLKRSTSYFYTSMTEENLPKLFELKVASSLPLRKRLQAPIRQLYKKEA